MNNSSGRRVFLKTTTTVAGGSVIAGAAAFSLNKTEKPNKTMPNHIKRIIPLGFQWETQDPFLFCVHHEDNFPAGTSNLGPDPSELVGRNIGSDFTLKNGWRMYHGSTVPGFPGHPHRGFETITVVRKGRVDHTDSSGASGRYGDGDVQWMTSGKGIQHAEMFPLVNQEKENPLELFQIWLNLPAKDKMVEPHFKMLWADSIPVLEETKNGKKVRIEIIAGAIGNKKAPSPPPNSWANNMDNQVAVWNIEMDSGAEWKLPKTNGSINRTIYFFKGDTLQIGSESIKEYYAAEVHTSEDIILKAGNEQAKILILQGRGIGEPVAQHGPFVMNTQDEIHQAFRDYKQTKFGGWPWDESGPVHEQGKNRFAYHADGTKEEKL